MIAREAPLYNNRNKYHAHPLLCDKFVYTFPFRSPIERILSWMVADTTFAFKGYPIEEESMGKFVMVNRDKNIMKEMMPYFFHTLFNSTIIDAKNPYTIPIMDGTNSKFVKIAARAQWLRGYASNGITRWLGYEWDVTDPAKNINGPQIVQPLEIDVRDFNVNDIHFYNAIRLLLQIDYVLPFASYDEDMSAIKACKYGDLENLVFGSKTIEIATLDDDGVWNVFARAINKHFHIKDKQIFEWKSQAKRSGRKGSSGKLADKLEEEDWKILYEMNYYDFRLYSLSKYIGEVDAEYGVKYLEELIKKNAVK